MTEESSFSKLTHPGWASAKTNAGRTVAWKYLNILFEFSEVSFLLKVNIGMQSQ